MSETTGKKNKSAASPNERPKNTAAIESTAAMQRAFQAFAKRLTHETEPAVVFTIARVPETKK